MELRCFICKREVDVGDELTLFFECHVYCGGCLQQMDEKEQAPLFEVSRQAFDSQSAY
ncbi:MAG: hypothetical protein GTO13_23235 [Proteobacteria bacterium]|nr:hypothetical protein [Pseudomonadota bacterium]NIS63492.1 hypothetical protein [Pseudomonadota bacterium]